jgi:hypothetical protein
VPDGGRDHAFGTDGLAAPRAVHTRLDVGVPVAVLGEAGGGGRRKARFVHVDGHGTGMRREGRYELVGS